ncbi:helix-turn-helix transcriptional regulator [Kitasatospora sp. NPDC094015]|uniref:helix-turn-helix domain-containing protein n=1 Tax=Kitasatospora sp. NPDC094015 TaxID=3155205 RepID=UPI00331B6A19
MTTQPSPLCVQCRRPLPPNDTPRTGRPALYCSSPCRQQAYKDRKKIARPGEHPVPTGPPLAPAESSAPSASTDLDETLAEIAKDIQDTLRELRSALGPDQDPSDPLRMAMQAQAQLEGLTAGLVGRARAARTPWAAIGELLNLSEDSARHRYTAAFVERRLGQLVRLRTQPTTPAPGRGPGRPAAGGESSPKRPAQSAAPPPPEPRQTTNRLAPVLSMLARTSQHSLQELGRLSGCSGSYISRILAGDKIPTWSLTERFAKACGADPAILRNVWESERLREPQPADHLPTAPADLTPEDGMRHLRSALLTLHVRAGKPTAYEIAVASRWQLHPDEVTALLSDSALDDWHQLLSLLRILGGDRAYFRPLWDAAHPEPELTEETVLQEVPKQVTQLDSPRTRWARFNEVLAAPLCLTTRQQSVLEARRRARLHDPESRRHFAPGQPTTS